MHRSDCCTALSDLFSPLAFAQDAPSRQPAMRKHQCQAGYGPAGLLREAV